MTKLTLKRRVRSSLLQTPLTLKMEREPRDPHPKLTDNNKWIPTVLVRNNVHKYLT